MVEQETKDNVTKKSTWLRFIYMILFAIVFNIAEVVIVVIVFVQFITKLFTGDVHERLQELGDSIAQYIADIVRYLTFQTEQAPFPFKVWPQGHAPERSQAPKAAAPKDEKKDQLLEAPKDDAPPSGDSTNTPPSTPPTSGGPTSS